jgi:DNA-damage-inducible protein D
METSRISKLFSSFEDIKHLSEDGIEYWSARELQKLLTYKDWRNFETVLEKAMEACRKAGNSKFDHFVGVNKMVSLGSDAEREVFDIHLTRYVSYLIAQNVSYI